MGKNDNIKFQKAGLDDFDSAYELFATSLKTQFPHYSKRTISFFLKKDYSKAAFKKMLDDKSKILFVAKSNGKVIGYLLGAEPYGGVALCNWIAVHANYQGSGVGSRLLGAWEASLKLLGVHKVHLWTDERNVEFYKKRGYKLVGKIPKDAFGADDYIFYKVLQAPKESKFT